MTGIQKRSVICTKEHVREKQVYSKVRVMVMSESCPMHQERSQCVTFAQGPQECHGAHSCAGETESQFYSHSASGTPTPETDPEGLLCPVREIIFPKKPAPGF